MPVVICRNNNGFTLIEMAIVLVIVGLLVGFGASLVRPLMERSKRNETQSAATAAVASVIGFAASNNSRLPDAALFPGTIKRRVDSWQNPIEYIYDSNLDVNTLGATICGRRTALITVRRCADSACATFTDVPNVAFMLISGAANRNNQTSGSRAVAAPVTINVYTIGVSADNYNGDFVRVEEYEDIVEWVTLNELRSKIGCQGPQMVIVNNEVPYGNAGSLYNITIYAGRGVPFTAGGTYKWCLKGTLPPGVATTPATPACPLTTDCSALGSEAASQWSQANSLQISGTPTTAGAYFFSVLSRDNNDGSTAAANDNCAEKSFVITINP
ncbi:MAG: prepilin-type N-terminal cleavage/methylation domain-containing protein [Pseudomonadota bacterium]